MQLDLPFSQILSRGRPETAEPPPGTRIEPIQFVRVRRARRYILRVRPDGTLRVTVPRGGSRREAEQFVRKHDPWIVRERRRIQIESSPREWQDGSEIQLRGGTTRITVVAAGDTRIVVYGDRQVPLNGDDDVRSAIERDLRNLARAELIPRIEALAAQHDLRIGSVSIRNQRSRWGSCARNGNIALNLRLVQMPEHIRDYVLLHELMHLKQQNHSRRFWRLVESVYPAFREAERWLKSSGRSLF